MSSDQTQATIGGGCGVGTGPSMRIPSEEIHSLRRRVDAQLATLLPASALVPPQLPTSLATERTNTPAMTNTMGTIEQRKNVLGPDQHWVVSYFI